MSRRYNPFEELEALLDRMNKQSPFEVRDVAVDVAEDEEDVVVTADLPGYDSEDIDLTIDEGRLTIRAERERSAEREDDHYHRRERTHEAVRRSVRLPAEVDEEAASASYANGVLTVTLPKVTVEDSEGHSIDIS